MNRRVFKVYEINRYIKSVLEEDVLLNGIFLEGEISNYKFHSSGHSYFTLKDEFAAINAVMFKSAKSSLRFEIENGLKVIAFGRVSLYEKTGNYQFYIEILEPFGQGALFLAFNQLKEKLDKEGLFSSAYKKPLPENPECIALITSKTGAAVRDMIKICKKRDSSVKLVVVNTLVQGENAPNDIVRAIKDVNKWGKCDIIILGRGGGSIEDLWAFNDENVARAIFDSKIPIISAVGHETDFTIADFVADIRASTPSNAAEIAVPEKFLKYSYIIQLYLLLVKNVNNKISYYKNYLDSLISNKYFKNPMQHIYDKQIYLSELFSDLQKETNRKLEYNKNKLLNMIYFSLFKEFRRYSMLKETKYSFIIYLVIFIGFAYTLYSLITTFAVSATFLGLAMMFPAFIIGCLVILWLGYPLKDKKIILIGLLAIGWGSGCAVYLSQNITEFLFILNSSIGSDGIVHEFLPVVWTIVPIVEELSKGIGIILIFSLVRQKSLLAGVVVGACVGLGFSFMEDVGYVASFIIESNEIAAGIGGAIVRSITIATHASFSTIIGAAIGYISSYSFPLTKRIGIVLISFVMAISVHGFLNYGNTIFDDMATSVTFVLTTTSLWILVVFIGAIIIRTKHPNKQSYT